MERNVSYSLESGLVRKEPPRILGQIAEACAFWTLKALNAALQGWIARRDIRRLMEMPDHLLDDIGLRRADIVCAVRSGRVGK